MNERRIVKLETLAVHAGRAVEADSRAVTPSITLVWSPVDKAQSYNLYFSTTPNVPPANGRVTQFPPLI